MSREVVVEEEAEAGSRVVDVGAADEEEAVVGVDVAGGGRQTNMFSRWYASD